MDEQTIGKIVITVAFGVPTAYWAGRLFHDILKGKVAHWAYERGFSNGWTHGYNLAVKDGKRESAERVAKRIEKELIAAIGQELGDG